MEIRNIFIFIFRFYNSKLFILFFSFLFNSIRLLCSTMNRDSEHRMVRCRVLFDVDRRDEAMQSIEQSMKR